IETDASKHKIREESMEFPGGKHRLFGTCGSASMAVALLSLAPAAIAQDTGTTVAGQRGETTEAAQNAIIVTGSRIARRDYSANSPLVTVGQDSFENRSDIGVEESLNELP